MGGRRMDIVDAQVHMNVIGTEAALAIMDAIGIQAVLIDEYAAQDQDGAWLPCYKLPNGAARPIAPNAEAAAVRFPDRFAYLMRINPVDPSLEAWLEIISASPNLRALRAMVNGPVDGTLFETGGFDRFFKAASAHGKAVFMYCPTQLRNLVPYIRRFPSLQFVIDHCGVDCSAPVNTSSLDDIVHMAEYGNVAVKWSHAPMCLSVEPYPFADLEPKLKRLIDAFGRERVMWASDYTWNRPRENWAESIFSIRHSSALSDSDKEWVLGRALRSVLRWPMPERPAPFRAIMHPEFRPSS